MADYTTHNDGVSGKGIFIALVVIGAFVFLLAVLGTSTVPTDPDGAADPAAIETAPAAPADTAPAVVE
ncbi:MULTISPECIES: hypothetical protein [unclassified Roseobacter]|uniref:hypothetical protein n=1 Tax=unclassified Roseobacter TaxID=196798 RepID=UPI0018A2FF76|nr:MULTISPECIES: hypothetical protein [unclassified Roseobacter]MDW3183838.1 hypothetical protein [Roseobacter sp.]